MTTSSDTPETGVMTARSPSISYSSGTASSDDSMTTPKTTKNPAAGDDTTTASPKTTIIPSLRRRRLNATATTMTPTTRTTPVPRSVTFVPRRPGMPHLLMPPHLLPKATRIEFPTEDVDLLMYSAKEICALIESERYEYSAPFLSQLHALSHRLSLLANNLAQVNRSTGRPNGIVFSPTKLMNQSVYDAFVADRQPLNPLLPANTAVANPPSTNQRTIKRLKIDVPEHPNYNFIGRILGPRGISVRQLEAATGCGVLIRGKGSVKNAEREERLRSRNTPGFEHLKEALHVLITAEGTDDADCERKLDLCKLRIDKLLKPEYDEFKRHQLAQLAMINGTYTPP